METKSGVGNIMRDLPRTGISDKLDHAIAGIGIFAITYYIGAKTGTSYAEVYALIVTIFSAALLELMQKYTNSGVASWADFFYTVAPAALFSGLIYFLR